jgi:hypothetical protein
MRNPVHIQHVQLAFLFAKVKAERGIWLEVSQGRQAHIYEANRAIRNADSILFTERNKKRGWKRKKARAVLSKYLYLAPLKSSKGFFTLRQTHFFMCDQYSQDEYYCSMKSHPYSTENKEERR